MTGPRSRFSAPSLRLTRGGREALRRAPKLVADWLWTHRVALSAPARLRALRWIDRPLARILRTKPRMLSSRVSIGGVPFQGSMAERLQLWLWEKHSVRFGLDVALLFGVGLFAAAIGIASAIDVPMLGPRSDIDGIPTMLVATAGYSGALFGFLQAVAIFAVQLRSQLDTSTLPLTPLIARRYFTFLILGSVAGITIANLLASFAAPVLPVSRSALATLTWINLLAVPIATLSAFWYLAEIVSEAGDADLDIAMPVLQATMRAQALEDARKATRLSEYLAALTDCGIQYNPFVHIRTASAKRSIERIGIAKSGVIQDLDCTRLRRVNRVLDELSPRPTAAVAFAMDDRVQPGDPLVLEWHIEAAPPTGHMPTLLSGTHSNQIGLALDSALFVRNERRAARARPLIAKDLQNFLRRFETTLTVLAREGRHVELDSRFDDYHKLLRAWLDAAPPGMSPPERVRLFAGFDKFAGPLEIDSYGIARAATLSGDNSTVVVLASQLLRAAVACMDRRQAQLAQEYFSAIVFLYYQCVQSDRLADALGERLDSALHSLMSIMQSQVPEMGDEPGSSDDSVYQNLNSALRFALSLTHAAIRYEQPKYASYFVERIFDHRKYGNRHRERVPPGAISPGVETLFDYVAVVLVGWSLHILQEQACENPEAARAVLSRALTHLPSPPVLAAEWELLRGADWREAAIDHQLGIAYWDVRDWTREYRAGVGEVRSGRTDWVRLGLRAAMLCTTERHWGDFESVFVGKPKRFVWKAAEEREALNRLASDEWLEIAEDERQRRIDSAMAVIESRARGADAGYLRYVLESPLSSARLSKLKEEASQSYQAHCAWQSALHECGVSSAAPKASPKLTRRGVWIPREYLLDDNNWLPGFGEHLGEDVAIREAIELVHSFEERASLGEAALDALARLPEVVRAGRRQLNNAGFEANVLILPREERFAGALFRKPLWQVEGRGEFGEASIGIWEQMHVLRFPYTNPKSILLIDTTHALAGISRSIALQSMKIWIEENSDNKDVAEKKAMAVRALESLDAELPKSSEIHVLAWMEAASQLVIANPGASLAIDIRESDGGYALVKGSDLYHRPSCKEIEFDEAEYVIRLPADCKRAPCPACRPERWNLEGRQGKVENQREASEES